MPSAAIQLPPAGTPPGWDCHTHVFDGRAAAPQSHYRPPVRDLATLAAEALRIGVGRLVLVQPSVYGTDNALLLDALRASDGRHRGVVVVDARASDRTLAEMHACGVRGVRFNRVSPAGNDEAAFAALAPRLREIGWHVQWYATPAQLPAIAELHRRHRLRCVLDHLAGFTPEAADDEGLFSPLLRLADMGAWIKLSGWYRLCAPPYDAVAGIAVRVAEAFAGRCVFGSDWPHTLFMEPGCRDTPPAYVDTWHPVVRALGAPAAQRILCEHPRALYE